MHFYKPPSFQVYLDTLSLQLKDYSEEYLTANTNEHETQVFLEHLVRVD